MGLYCLHCASWFCPKTKGGHSGLLVEESIPLSDKHRYEIPFEEYIKIYPNITIETYGGTAHKIYWLGMKKYLEVLNESRS